MSDEGEIDIESDDVAEISEMSGSTDKRAHHNALERKRRDHIKDSFTNLRDCIPAMSGEKVSRAHILNKATEYIRQMQRCSATRTTEIDELKKKNEILEEQINALEQAKSMGNIENPEELIASIAEKVQQRQTVRQQQNNKSGPKVQLDSTGDNSKGSDKTTLNDPGTHSSSFNVLANNIRTTQNLLTALAKNLPTNSNNPQVRSLAARVLASPLRPQNPISGGVPPRGVVTATAVPASFQNTSPLVRPPIQGGGVVLATPTPQPVLNIPLQISHSVDNPLSLVVNSIPVCPSNESDTTNSVLELSSTLSDKVSDELDVESLINIQQHNEDDTREEEPPSKRVKTES